MIKSIFFIILISFQSVLAYEDRRDIIDLDEYGYTLILSLRDESYNPTDNKDYTDSLFIQNIKPESISGHEIIPRSVQVFRMDMHSSLQKQIDSTYESILKTTTGRQICQLRTDGSLKSIMSYFGISEGLAKKIIPTCKSLDSNKKISLYPQKYFLVATEENFALDSWTTHQNETYFYIDAKKYKNLYTAEFYNHLTKLIVHELNIKSDTAETKLVKLLEDKKLIKSNLSECELQTAINNTYIKNAFRAIRSFVLENRIMSEMNMMPKDNSNVQYSCKEKILNVLQPVINIASALHADNAYFAYTVINKCSQNLNQLPDSIDKIINILSSTYINDGQFSVSLCEYLSIPKYNNESRLILTSGPRPRVGGGSSDDTGEHSQTNIDDLILKLNSNTKKSIQNKNLNHFKNYKMNVENYSEWVD